MYSDMVLSRTIEERMLLALRQGKLSKWFSGIGQEAISIGITNALNDNDTILPMHRNLGIFTSRNIDLNKLFCQLMGKSGGFTKGRDRSFHFGSKQHHIIGMISHLAAMLPVACGIGLGIKNSKQKFNKQNYSTNKIIQQIEKMKIILQKNYKNYAKKHCDFKSKTPKFAKLWSNNLEITFKRNENYFTYQIYILIIIKILILLI